MSIRFSSIFLSIIMFIGVVSGFSVFYNDLADKSGVEHSDLSKTFAQTQIDINSKVTELKTKGNLEDVPSTIVDLSYFAGLGMFKTLLNLPDVI